MSKLVLLFTKNIEAATQEIKWFNGRVTQRFTGAVFEAQLPDFVDVEVLKYSQTGPFDELDEVSQLVVNAWRDNEVKFLRKAAGLVKNEKILKWDTPGYQHPVWIEPFPGLAGKTTGTPTSLFLTGPVSLGLVVVSGPGGLAFSDAERRNVVSEVMEGLQFLATAEPAANITFIYNIHFLTVDADNSGSCSATNYELCEAVWRDPALVQLHFSPGLGGCEQFANDIKAHDRSNWSYIAFFTKYKQSHFAYAGGVRLCMQYSNDNWGPDKINQLFAHETCHIFGAADEYGDSGCGCGPAGFYKVPNGNCINCTNSQIDCLMNKNTLSLCNWSRGQIGWPEIIFGPSTQYSDGKQNSIAMDSNGNCVEVHAYNDSSMYYHVGKADFAAQTITWGLAKFYDYGTRNAIAMDDSGNCIEVHQGGTNWYHVGKVDFVNQTIAWGPSTEYDGIGGSPAIAMDNNGNCVEVHVVPPNNLMYYHVGKADFTSKTITWGLAEFYDSGTSNTIAMDDNGNCIEVHVGGHNWYHVGKIDFGHQTITWGPTIVYEDIGGPNAIAMDNNGNCIEVHVVEANNLMYSHVGKVDVNKQTINWGAGLFYDSGTSNAIAMNNNGNCIEVHKGGFSWYHTGRIIPVTG